MNQEGGAHLSHFNYMNALQKLGLWKYYIKLSRGSNRGGLWDAFAKLNNGGSRFTDIKNLFSQITKIRKISKILFLMTIRNSV